MKNVLITGANKGIGFEVAKKMASLGYFVFLACRDSTKGDIAISKLKEAGFNNVDSLRMDVSDLESVKKAQTELEAKINVLDILINNAGISGGKLQNISSCDIFEIKKIFDTNFFGAIQVTQHFLPLMRKSELPVIVNVSSELASFAWQTASDRKPSWDNFHIYGATKTALNMLTVLLAEDLKGTSFKVNSVTPGYTSTGLNNFEGLKTVEQGAEPIVALAIIDKDGPTGQFYQANGIIEW